MVNRVGLGDGGRHQLISAGRVRRRTLRIMLLKRVGRDVGGGIGNRLISVRWLLPNITCVGARERREPLSLMRRDVGGGVRHQLISARSRFPCTVHTRDPTDYRIRGRRLDFRVTGRHLIGPGLSPVCCARGGT
jgi:hypothetical protein